MKFELDKQICKEFPKIFAKRNMPPQETNTCFGFECGDGWYNLLHSACSVIQNHIDWSRTNRLNALKYNRALKQALNGKPTSLVKYFTFSNGEVNMTNVEATIDMAKFREVPEACDQVVAAQVKEKFGSLRFYVYGGDNYTQGVIDMAETLSANTCEECGVPGTIERSSWLQCLCSTCRKNKEYGNEKL